MKKLMFKKPIFHGGFNTTIRNGTGWVGRAESGDDLELVDIHGEPIGPATFCFAETYTLRQDQAALVAISRFANDPEAKEWSGIVDALNDVYGAGKWGPKVTVVGFMVPHQVALQAQEPNVKPVEGEIRGNTGVVYFDEVGFEHHTPKTLTEADAKADLEGTPRPSSDEPEITSSEQPVDERDVEVKEDPEVTKAGEKIEDIRPLDPTPKGLTSVGSEDGGAESLPRADES